MALELKFSTDWNNKLGCKCFTTIRQSNKYKPGEKIEIRLNGEFVKYGEVLIQKELKVRQLTESMCFIDTGYDRKQTLEIISKMFGAGKIGPEAPVYWYLIGPWKAEQLTMEL